jgi:hypothetical protein
MASNEGIGSSFLQQPSARSPKPRIYESLFLLNEGMDRRNFLIVNASMKVDSGSNAGSPRRNGATYTDNAYIEVGRREEERKKQGLPPRLGILPHSAAAEEEDRWEALVGAPKKKRSKKRGKSDVGDRQRRRSQSSFGLETHP